MVLLGLIRDYYRPKERELIKKYGDYTITNIVVHKKPVRKSAQYLLNAITKFKFSLNKQQFNLDELYHLYAVLYLESLNGDKIMLRIEKSEQIHFNIVKKLESDQSITVPNVISNPTLFKTFLERGEKTIPNYFYYDHRYANCQMFISGLLLASNYIQVGDKVYSFINQDVQDFLKSLGYKENLVIKSLTNVSGILDRLIYGKGNLFML